jgi:septal ring factor EnvC (AmiA/AmiB activator)
LSGAGYSSWAQGVSKTHTADSGQIHKNLIKKKKDLAAVEKKLKEEKEKQRLSILWEKNVLNHLQQVDQALGRLKREKETNQEYLEETRLRLDRLHSNISQNKMRLAQSRELLKRRLRDLYRMSFRVPFLGGILDSESLGDLARKLKFEMLLAESNGKILSQTLETERELENSSLECEREQQRKVKLVSALGRQEATYSQKRKNRASLLVSIHRQQAMGEQTIAELKDQAEELQAKVTYFLQEARNAKKNASWVPAGTGLWVIRGKIPWPVTGPIIKPYGRYKDKEFNEMVDNSGIQIGARQGTPFRAVAAGRVRFADWFKGYGKLVILDHGEGYYSLYAQADELDVSVGEKVAAGQILGTVGDTGSLVGTSLYFEIRKNGVPQDPLHWLQHRSRTGA